MLQRKVAFGINKKRALNFEGSFYNYNLVTKTFM